MTFLYSKKKVVPSANQDRLRNNSDNANNRTDINIPYRLQKFMRTITQNATYRVPTKASMRYKSCKPSNKA